MNARTDHDAGDPPGDHASYWDDRYGQSERIWSGEPNAGLVEEAADLTPGTALDLGCGEGGDAVWLAARGWRVTAVDVSRVALDRVAAHATAAGVADRVRTEWHDLTATFPEGRFDLVSAQYLYSPPLPSPGRHPNRGASHRSPIPMSREDLLRRAAAAVAPGGVLVIGSHGGFAPWEDNPHPEMRFPPPAEIVADLGLDDGGWDVLRASDLQRTQAGPDGAHHPRTDNVVTARRR